MTMHQCTRLTKTLWLSKTFTERQTTQRDNQFLLSPDGSYWQSESHFLPYPNVSRLSSKQRKLTKKHEITSWWIAAIGVLDKVNSMFFSYPRVKWQMISAEISQAKWQSCIKTTRSLGWFLSMKVRAILDLAKRWWMTPTRATRTNPEMKIYRKMPRLCWKINWPPSGSQTAQSPAFKCWTLSILMVELLIIACAFEKSVP